MNNPHTYTQTYNIGACYIGMNRGETMKKEKMEHIHRIHWGFNYNKKKF